MGKNDEEILEPGGNGLAYERAKERLLKRYQEGHHLRDCCQLEGIPFSYIIANINDKDFRAMYNGSMDREVMCARDVGPVNYTPSMARDNLLRILTLAGLQDKYAMLAATADPFTDDGRKALKELQPLLLKLIPAATEVKVEEKKEMTVEEIEAELEQLKQLDNGSELAEGEVGGGTSSEDRGSERDGAGGDVPGGGDAGDDGPPDSAD